VGHGGNRRTSLTGEQGPVERGNATQAEKIVVSCRATRCGGGAMSRDKGEGWYQLDQGIRARAKKETTSATLRKNNAKDENDQGPPKAEAQEQRAK